MASASLNSNTRHGSSKDCCYPACSMPSMRSTRPNINFMQMRFALFFWAIPCMGVISQTQPSIRRLSPLKVPPQCLVIGVRSAGGLFRWRVNAHAFFPLMGLDIAAMYFPFRGEREQRRTSIIGEKERFLKQSSAHRTILRLARGNGLQTNDSHDIPY